MLFVFVPEDSKLISGGYLDLLVHVKVSGIYRGRGRSSALNLIIDKECRFLSNKPPRDLRSEKKSKRKKEKS